MNAATHDAVDILMAGLRQAPSVPAWCDEVYRFYGPGGVMVADLLRRQPVNPSVP